MLGNLTLEKPLMLGYHASFETVMRINLKLAAASTPPQLTLEINQRLPSYLKPPCILQCQYHVEKRDNYYLLTLNVSGELTVTCQRCLQEFTYPYSNETQIAICSSEQQADELMAYYECLVSAIPEVDIDELVTDELHLYVPESHSDTTLCDPTIAAFIATKAKKK